MTAAVLKQIFTRASTGKSCVTHEEIRVVRNAITDSRHEGQAGNFITRIALDVAPLEGDTHDEQVASRLAFAAKHLSNLQDFLDCRLTATQLKEGAALLH